MHLSKVKIENFRCLGSVELDLKPITIIYGLNGSGKSSILAAIQLLKQSLGKEQLVTEEPFSVGSFKTFVRDVDPTRWVSIGLEVSFDKDEFLKRSVFSNVNEFVKYVNKVSLPVKNIGYEISFREKEWFLELDQVVKMNGVPLVKTRTSWEKGTTRDELLIPEVDATPTNPRRILDESMGYINFSKPSKDMTEIRKMYGELVKDIARMFRDFLKNYFVLGPTRATGSFEAQTPTSPEWVGQKGENVTGVLSMIWGSTTFSQKRLKISKWAEIFGLSDLWAGFQGDNKLGITFRDPESNTPINLNWAGHGSKQMLIAITQLFFSDEGAIVALEEPEISLHLKLQMELPKLFAEVIREKKQVIVTSHSSQFLTAFRQSFKNRTLTTKDLAVCHLKKTRNGTTIEKLKVTKQGIITPFIPSIAAAEKKLISEAFE